MLFKLSEVVKKTNNLLIPHKGIVVDNKDPKKLNRVKCIIEGILETDIYSDLPWIHPVIPISSASSTSTNPPELNTELWVEFPMGIDSLYQPIYKGYWYSQNNGISHPQNPSTRVFGDDYPFIYGSQDSTGNYFMINKKQETVDIEHSSGTHLKINKNGELILTGKHKLIFTGESDITLESKTGSLNLLALQKVTVKGTAGVDVVGSMVKLASSATVAGTLLPVLNGVITGSSPCIFGPLHGFGSSKVLSET